MKIAFLCIVILASCSSFPVSISEGVFTSEASIGRNLLQAKKPCPVNFEFMNYTIITSRCKGPKYPANLCCEALKDFACPYSAELNDLANECSTEMFSYINLSGKYPPGLFSSLCHDDKIGLQCPAPSPGTTRNGIAHSNNTQFVYSPSLMVILTTAFVILFFQ